MTEVHPLFADSPSLEPLAWGMMKTLHSQVPEGKAPISWSDYSPEQVLRAKEAAYLVYAGAIEHAASQASRSSYGSQCDSRGVQDPETGEVPCDIERDDRECLCSEHHSEAVEAGARVRALLKLDFLLQPFHPGFEREVAAAALRIRRVIWTLTGGDPRRSAEEPIGADEIKIAEAALGVSR